MDEDSRSIEIVEEDHHHHHHHHQQQQQQQGNEGEERDELIPEMTLSSTDDDSEEENDYESVSQDEDNVSESEDEDEYEDENEDEEEDEDEDSIADGTTLVIEKPVNQENGDEEEVNRRRGEIDVCPICFQQWTSSGDHQICCLPCGHIYGMSCIKKWLQRKRGSGKCPQCNNKCTLKGVRVLYVTRVCVADDDLNKRLQSLEAKHKAGQSSPPQWLSEREDQLDRMESFLKGIQAQQTELIDQSERLRQETRDLLTKSERMARFQKEKFAEQTDFQRAQLFMTEYNQYQLWLHHEAVRHYHDARAGRPYLEHYTPIDYSKLNRLDPLKIPPYPGMQPPMFYRPPPSGQSANPFDMSPMLKRLEVSILKPIFRAPDINETVSD